MMRQRYLGGRFEANVNAASHFGAASIDDAGFLPSMPDGTVRNHEIDIESRKPKCR